MNFYADETYGERVAGVYDEWYSEYDPNAIDALAELARNGRVGSSRVDLQACKLEYSIVSPK